MVALSTVLIALAIAYSVVLARFTHSFRRLIDNWAPQAADPLPTVTVVIAARNEAPRIGACIHSILANDYAPELVRVVVVDDASEDDTVDVVAALSGREPRVNVLETATGRGGGKRRAIEAGVDTARSEIILLTDADCTVPPRWIESMVSTFTPETRFVAGPVAYESANSWIGRILELELLGLVAVGGGAIALRRPNMCNGACVAFRRTTFYEVGGYTGTEHTTSGDDELLMQKIARAHPGSVAFCPSVDALVETNPPETIRALFQQRKRWASKGFRYRDMRVTGLAVLVYLFNLALLASVVAALTGAPILEALTVSALLKVGAEGWLFWTACGHFKRRYLIPWMIPGQLFIVPYVLIVGAAGTLGGYEWKGRDIRR